MDDDGRHDFDFLFGSWRIANRKRTQMLARGHNEWVEFEAYGEARPILGGLGNVDTYSAPDFPGRPGFEGFTLRLFEPDTGQWKIWWASTIGEGRLDPPVAGSFEGDTGRFEGDDVLHGVPIRVRFDWSVLTDDAVRWEQSFSFDAGRTWEKNWIMDSTRVAAVEPAAPALATRSG